MIIMYIYFIDYKEGALPRTPRIISSTGYMHVISKGNNGQILFECPEDYRNYLFFLQKDCLETGVMIKCDRWSDPLSQAQ